jgi:hypothetical protein
LFRRLAIFVGGCTLDAAEAVCDAGGDLGIDVFDGLSSLAEKGLLHPQGGPDGEARFAMLQTIREYAREQLVDANEEASLAHAQAAHFLGLATRAAQVLRGPGSAAWRDRLEADRENLGEALELFQREGKHEAVVLLAQCLRHVVSRGYLVECRQRLQGALSMKGWEDHPELLTMILLNSASLAQLMGEDTSVGRGALGELCGDDKAARDEILRALEISERGQFAMGIVRSCLALASLSLDHGDHESALAYLAQGEPHLDQVDRERTRITGPASEPGHEASDHHHRADRGFAWIGSPRASFLAHKGLALLQTENKDNLELATGLTRRAIDLWNARQDRGSVAWGRECLARMYRARGERTDARREAVETLSWRAGPYRSLPGTLLCIELLAELEFDEGRLEKGLFLAAAAERIREAYRYRCPPSLKAQFDAWVRKAHLKIDPRMADKVQAQVNALELEDLRKQAVETALTNTH